MAQRARLFQNGGSQAVRIPAAMRFEGDEVEIEHDPVSGVITLRPTEDSRKALVASVRDRIARIHVPTEVSKAHQKIMEQIEDEDEMPLDGGRTP
ncbi:MAG: AbrB/MazE/SpoVT family DNA-binding domain-containing protein [Geminicoccaceae bacterium]